MSIFVITPTYNERANLEALVQKIFSLGISGLSLIVVDDNSPDRTGELAEELSKKYPIKVIHRPQKSGLGTAYIEAFKEILRSAQDDALIIQMDADLSHDPSVIPQLLEKAGYPVIASPVESGTLHGVDSAKQSLGDRHGLRPRDDTKCDLVLGSRYVKVGKIENWDFFRKLISRFGNIYARIVLGLPYRDLTGGFKCYRREVLQKMDLDSLSSVGYNFQIETTYRAHQAGFKICEIPISFTERKIGASKFNLGIILESFWKVLLLRFRE